MADVENILNDDKFFWDIVDTSKEGIDQHRKRECLKGVKGKAYLLRRKWTQEKVDKSSDETINRKYAEYRQRELNKKGEKLERPWANMLLICIPVEFLEWFFWSG